MHRSAPSLCFFIISRARSMRYSRMRSQLTRCCQSSPAMPKFAVPMESSRCAAVRISVVRGKAKPTGIDERNNIFGAGSLEKLMRGVRGDGGVATGPGRDRGVRGRLIHPRGGARERHAIRDFPAYFSCRAHARRAALRAVGEWGYAHTGRPALLQAL